MKIVILTEDDPEILKFLEGRNVWVVEVEKEVRLSNFLQPKEEKGNNSPEPESITEELNVEIPRCDSIVTCGKNKGQRCSKVAYKKICGKFYCTSHYNSRLPVCEFSTRYRKCSRKVEDGEKRCSKHLGVIQCTVPLGRGKNEGSPCLQEVVSGEDVCSKHLKVTNS